jgi:hypothetical protein
MLMVRWILSTSPTESNLQQVEKPKGRGRWKLYWTLFQIVERADGVDRLSMLIMMPRPWTHIWFEMIAWKNAGFKVTKGSTRLDFSQM